MFMGKEALTVAGFSALVAIAAPNNGKAEEAKEKSTNTFTVTAEELLTACPPQVGRPIKLPEASRLAKSFQEAIQKALEVTKDELRSGVLKELDAMVALVESKVGAAAQKKLTQKFDLIIASTDLNDLRSISDGLIKLDELKDEIEPFQEVKDEVIECTEDEGGKCGIRESDEALIEAETRKRDVERAVRGLKDKGLLCNEGVVGSIVAHKTFAPPATAGTSALSGQSSYGAVEVPDWPTEKPERRNKSFALGDNVTHADARRQFIAAQGEMRGRMMQAISTGASILQSVQNYATAAKRTRGRQPHTGQ
jgi:hypothetical protein